MGWNLWTGRPAPVKGSGEHKVCKRTVYLDMGVGRVGGSFGRLTPLFLYLFIIRP